MTSRTRLMLCGFGSLLVVIFASLLLTVPPDGVERGDLAQFFGRFHPLVVHLPVAFVLLVAVLECAGFFTRAKDVRHLAGFVLALAAASAVLAVSLGWLLARSGGYEGQLVTRHMWGGVSLSAALVLCCALHGWNAKAYRGLLFVALCLMLWTADQGGKLTHGTTFLTEHMPQQLRALLGVPRPAPRLATPSPATSAVSAATTAPAKVSRSFFVARVAPIFEDRCTTCHGPEKKKGKLRLDTFDYVMRGGKDGVVVKPGDPKGSELFRRITLPRDNKDAMPAEGKPGLTQVQIKVIESWIASGAAQDIAVEEVRGAPPIPSPKPAPPPAAVDYHPRLGQLQALQRELGVQLVPRSEDPRDGLILRTVTAPEKCNDATLAALHPVADLIVDAELSRTKITDVGTKVLGNFPNLIALDLSHTSITSSGLAPLEKLTKLESLNLTATDVDDKGVLPFRHRPGLRHLYLFETKCTMDAERTRNVNASDRP